jgi:hypothetical protein
VPFSRHLHVTVSVIGCHVQCTNFKLSTKACCVVLLSCFIQLEINTVVLHVTCNWEVSDLNLGQKLVTHKGFPCFSLVPPEQCKNSP